MQFFLSGYRAQSLGISCFPQVHKQGAESKVEQLRHEAVPTWYADITGSGLLCIPQGWPQTSIFLKTTTLEQAVNMPLGTPASTLECLDLSTVPASHSSFLLMCAKEGSR